MKNPTRKAGTPVLTPVTDAEMSEAMWRAEMRHAMWAEIDASEKHRAAIVYRERMRTAGELKGWIE